jgi:hypothetical protein
MIWGFCVRVFFGARRRRSVICEGIFILAMFLYYCSILEFFCRRMKFFFFFWCFTFYIAIEAQGFCAQARSRRLQGADEEQVLGFTASTLNGQWLMLRKGQRSPSSLHNYQCGWEQLRTGKVGAARAEGGNASGRPRRRTAGQKDASGTKQYYFTREADEPSSFSPINGEFISMAVTAGAVVGLGFGKTFCLGLCKYVVSSS